MVNNTWDIVHIVHNCVSGIVTDQTDSQEYQPHTSYILHSQADIWLF